MLALGKFRFGFGVETLQTLTLVTLVLSVQGVFYVVRERRRLRSSRPSAIVVLSSIADLLLIPTLAVRGILLAPLPLGALAAVFAAAMVFAFVLNEVKAQIFRRLRMV